jgi:TetR/AcrR family transcriptional repressor of nem operon
MDLRPMPRKTDKREKLIGAAKVLIHQQGFNLTTLADIAQEADVPLGNVYYYFKTKDAIGEAVIERRSAEIAEYLTKLEENTDPRARLISLLHCSTEEMELTARYGCSVGGLCQELGKQGGPLADQAAKLLHDMIAWSEAQFKSLGFSERSNDLAVYLVSSIQGMYLLTHTFKDPKLATRQAKMIQDWLEKLTSGSQTKTAAGSVSRIAELA